ncbi:hypothetical protein HDU97_001773 [Phlyctochytrium planicorne]|nr:hypothetical protein HDU97_001773 [Phlyctochytrium planicorne]
MQEVTIKARSAFKHYVTVDTPGKELCWNFCTRKKNISFGLYKKADANEVVSSAGSSKSSSLADVDQAGAGASNTNGMPLSPAQTPRKSSVGAPSGVNRTAWDPELVELIPIAHYDSSKYTIKGQFVVDDPGTYVLFFDNTFSVNTSKKLFFFVALRDVEPAAIPVKKTVDGWILKKGNRKMQGYAKRWLKIDADGNLSYYRIPGSESRGYISLLKAAIRLDHDHLLIDIDSGSDLMHFKAITPQDFQMWVEALQSHAEAKTANLEGEYDLSSPTGNSGDLAVATTFISASPSFKSPESPTPTGHPLESEERSRDPAQLQSYVLNGADGDIETLQRNAENLIITLNREIAKMKDLIDTSRSRIDNKSQWKDFTLILGSISDVASGVLSNSMALQRNITVHGQSVRNVKDRASIALRQTELSLRAAVADNNRVRRKFGLETVTVAHFLQTHTGSLSSIRGARGPVSGSSSVRDDVFFDAEEPIAQDYNSDDDEDDDSMTSEYLDNDDDPMTNGEIEEDLGDGVYDDDDEDGQYDDAKVASIDATIPAQTTAAVTVVAKEEALHDAVAAAEKELPTPSSDPKQEKEELLTYEQATAGEKGNAVASSSQSKRHDRPQMPDLEVAKPIARRKTLPAPAVSMENISILSILRNNVGKDLSTVAMPIALNEPLNLLQKLVEELEYCELLEEAGRTEDPISRIVIMAAFAVSGYASTVNRAGRKPFNPLLGETYECIREDKNFRFIAEKVCHHPPIMACYAQSKGYTFFQDNLVKTKFWGKSMELIPSGTVHVDLHNVGDHYSWSKVTTCMRNVFSSGRYLEHYGTMKIVSRKTGHYCQLTFKESGYFTSAKNEVGGVVFTAEGEEVAWLSGKWDDSLCRFNKATPNNLEVIWRARPCPPNYQQMYGFTSFAVELNEITPDIADLLPNTDTRFRTDQRMYEEGKLVEAEKEKLRLEQKQREYRKKLEAQGQKWIPQWFEEVPAEPEDGEAATVWRYKTGYFENRGKFETKIELWAVGYCEYGLSYYEPILEALQKEAERCESLQSFFMISSLGGGTGSGLGSKICEMLYDEFQKVYRFNSVLCPSATDDVVTSPYNSILSLSKMIDNSDCVLPMENQALADIANLIRQKSDPALKKASISDSGTRQHGGLCGGANKAHPFEQMNNIAANLLINITSSMRFEGSMNVDISDIVTNLVPFPRQKFLLSTMTPLYTLTDMRIAPKRIDQLFSDAFNRESQLVRADPKFGVYLAVALIGRGDIQISDIRRNIDRLKPHLKFANLHHYLEHIEKSDFQCASRNVRDLIYEYEKI